MFANTDPDEVNAPEDATSAVRLYDHVWMSWFRKVEPVSGGVILAGADNKWPENSQLPSLPRKVDRNGYALQILRQRRPECFCPPIGFQDLARRVKRSRY